MLSVKLMKILLYHIKAQTFPIVTMVKEKMISCLKNLKARKRIPIRHFQSLVKFPHHTLQYAQ